MLVGLRVADNPEEAVAVSVTVPVKPLSAFTVIVDIPEAPAFTVTVVGLAVTLKSEPCEIVKPTATE